MVKYSKGSTKLVFTFNFSFLSTYCCIEAHTDFDLNSSVYSYNKSWLWKVNEIVKISFLIVSDMAKQEPKKQKKIKWLPFIQWLIWKLLNCSYRKSVMEKYENIQMVLIFRKTN